MGASTRRLSWVVPGASSLVVLMLLLAGCATPAQNSLGTAASPPAVKPLPTGAKVDYQLGGGYTPPSGVAIVTRDSTDKPAVGVYNICYVNGFQTQGQDRRFWLDKHPALVLKETSGSSVGKPVTDPGWPDEMILDTSTPAKRAAIAETLSVTLRMCAKKGFDAVEFDNLDSYTRSHHRLTRNDNIATAKLLVSSAHRLGLAAGQKNTSQLGRTGPDIIHFDFAVAEECYRYDECASYTKFYGAHVIDIEYTDDLRGSFAAACAAKQTPPMTILRDRDLTTPRSSKYVYRSC